MKDRAVDLSEKELKNFITSPDEKIFVLKREHPITLVSPVIFSLITAGLVTSLTYFVAVFLFHSPNLYIGLSLLTLVTTISLITKSIVDYYFHFFVVSNRKILEMTVMPLYKDKINDVLLDQVRITEIDVRMNNIINEVFDMGDVIIEFDRPSHLELFTLNNISNPKEIGTLLTRELQSVMHDSPIWFQPRKTSHSAKFHDDLFPEEEGVR